MSDDLRTLAQAVADSGYGSNVWRAAMDAMETHLGADCISTEGALAILAALAAADAQGYARAMGEVEARAEERCVKRRQQADAAEERSPGRSWLLACVIEAALMRDWAKRAARTARERLPAAAEKEHGG